MRSLEKNKRKIFYALVSDTKEMVKDSDGNNTGELRQAVSEPIECWINHSPEKGTSENMPFGDLKDYDKVMSTTDMSLPITETSLLWIDETDIAKPHDYKILRIAKSLNQVLYAVKKVR